MANNLSEAKSAGHEGAPILGHRQKGGIVILPDGKPGALKHNSHRYNHGSDTPWGREGSAYIEADIIPVGYHLELRPQSETVRVTSEWLAQQEQGIQPEHATVGAEVEGVVYEPLTTLLASAHGPLFPLEHNNHPELLDHMLETATGQTREGSYPRTALNAAQSISQAVLEAEETARIQDKRLVYSSVPEAGSSDQVQITPHPYLIAFSPKVLEATINHAHSIPPEVIALYRKLGVDILPDLAQTGILNWPVNALHVHNGVPQIDGLADPRSAYAMAQVRMTNMAKAMSLPLYNTRHCYGVDTGLKDVRSLMRRLLATSHDSTLPEHVGEFISKAVSALEEGDIHSLPRHPWQGQHDRIRMRMDGEKKTMESIDAPQSPDLRQVLGWIYANQIMNTIALEALHAAGGEESAVLPYLQKQYGSLMAPIPALGNGSSYHHDLIFNIAGYDGTIPWMDGKTYRQVMQETSVIIGDIGQRYPALAQQTRVLQHLYAQQTSADTTGISLEEYLGVEQGAYRPNGKNRGLITDTKDIPLADLITIQDEATRLQAQSLSQVRDKADLNDWFGIN